MNLGEMVEKLCIANIKLYNLCDLKTDMSKNPADYTKEQLVTLMEQDIQLCKERAKLKNIINKSVGIEGEEIKRYGPS